jgi:NADH:ubiquinone oxidoreductase subunit F (NADH-binding)/NADH:ubiquinone oxidoreductase subunit E
VKLIRELTRIQHERGCLDAETLREIAARENVPLYRLEGLVGFYPHFRRTPAPNVTVRVCCDVTCSLGGCHDLTERLRETVAGRSDITIEEVSCLGRCDSAPAVTINDIPIAPMTLADFDTVTGFLDNLDSLPSDEPSGSSRDWQCDPYTTHAERYGTVRALNDSPDNSLDDLRETCVAHLKDSGLSGMGGAGFPTGLKWELVAAETEPTKYVICNADESEPGTFKDRAILEELPHLVIEGMLLAGLTIGAERGIIFLRHEYARERKSLVAALEAARSAGVLGENAAGSGRAFDIEIFDSPGGYILGEETALLEALEDKRGEPRNKPPYPGTHGLWGKPTLINNVETFALATSIIHHGADWWRDQGVGNSAGLKFTCISGDVTSPGVFEIPMGTSVQELVDLAGGVPDDKPLKAFLPGGASSKFLPADKIDTPLDFDAMKAAGSMLGTGAVIVFAADRDLFAAATNLVSFFRNESCGKCVPCRIGSQRAVELLEEVGAGKTSPAALQTLSGLGETLEQTSLCGLGQVALNPILSMLEHFPDEAPK